MDTESNGCSSVDARGHLEIDIVNMISKYLGGEQLQDAKTRLTILLSNYEVGERKTELVLADENTNAWALQRFLSAKMAAGRTDKTLNFYKSSLIQILAKIGKNFNEITSDDIRLYMALRLKRDMVSKVTVNNERRVLSAFYAYMHLEGIISRNPMARVELIKMNKQKKKAFTQMEVELIRNACTTNREKAIVEVLLSTWCRVTEVSQIRLDEIDDQEIIVHGKGEKDRTVYLTPRAIIAIREYLEERKDDNPYLFAKRRELAVREKGYKQAEMRMWYKKPELTDKKEHLGKETIESIVRKLGKRAKVENVHPHRFRRTGATMALQAGMPLITVSKLLGHADIGVTQVYLDISDEELQEAHVKYVR